MSALVVSKKGKAHTLALIIGFVLLFFAVWSLANPSDSFGVDDEFESVINVLTPMLTAFGALFFFMRYNSTKKAHIDVYTDHIEGQGVNSRFGLESFRYNKNECTVTQQGCTVYVSSSAGKLQLYFTPEDAAEVYQAIMNGQPNRYVNYNSQQNSNAGQQKSAEPTIQTCPHCGAQCRVPGNKGHIKITCPRCKRQFDAFT